MSKWGNTYILGVRHTERVFSIFYVLVYASRIVPRFHPGLQIANIHLVVHGDALGHK